MHARARRALREHKAASTFKVPTGFVFASETGGPLGHRNMTARGLEKARKAAGLDSSDGKPPVKFQRPPVYVRERHPTTRGRGP
jgi:hypothetical protein